MANKYEEEIEQEKLLRDALILERITSIYKDIREKARQQAKSVKDKAGKDKSYFNTGTTLTDFQEEFNKDLRPDYVKRDVFSRKVYTEEYNTAYFQAKFTVENQGIKDGYKFSLPRYTDDQFTEARDYALSKLMNKSKMVSARNINITQLEDVIVSGVQQGLSLPKINRELDIMLGFRDSDGKWIDEVVDRKRQQYETQRILRSEIGRVRADAETDLWINSQDIVKSELQNLEVRDNRTRRQSVSMDLAIADKNGEFLFPNGIRARMRKSGVKAYDINDRQTLITLDPEYKPTQRIARNPETGKNEILPFGDFKSWAKDNDLRRNVYGEWLDID